MMQTDIIFSPIPMADLVSSITKDVVANILPLIPNPPVPPVPNTIEEYSTRREIASLIGVSLPTVDKYTIQGKIRGYRFGRQIRYKKSEVVNSMALI